MEENQSKISNIEWALVIGALFLIDGLQIVLEWLLPVVGDMINIAILDPFVGMGLAFYLSIRGEKLLKPARIGGLVITFLLELIPIVDELPLWGLDGIFNMVISKGSRMMTNKQTGPETPPRPQPLPPPTEKEVIEE